MTEATLAALIAGGFSFLIALVNVLGKRLERQVLPEHPEPEHDELSEADVLRSGIRRHIIRCPRPEDLIDLL